MSKNVITKEVLDNKTLINKFKNKCKYFFDTKCNNYKLKASEINENYNLDCSEYDDHIAKSINEKDKFYVKVLKNIENFDQVNGINYYNNKVEDEKKDRIQDFIDKLNEEKNNINHLISTEEKEFEIKHKEKNDEIFSKEKEIKSKLSEAKKRLMQDLSREEHNLLKQCDGIEKDLLDTNDKIIIKELIEKETKIRLEYINTVYTIKSNYYSEIKELKIIQANQKNDGIIEVANMKTEAAKIRNKHRTDVDVVIEKIKAREDYYISISSTEGVDYFTNLINELNDKKRKNNDEGYSREKDVLNYRLKQIKFIEKEYSNVTKKILALLNGQIDEFYDSAKTLIDIIKKYVNFFDPKFKKVDGDPKNQKELFALLNNIKNILILNNGELINNLGLNDEDTIKYINYPLVPLKEKLNEYHHNYIASADNLYQSIIDDKSSEEFSSIYSFRIKELIALLNNYYKDIKAIIKDYLTEGKEFVKQICKEMNLKLNNDTVEVDDKFNAVEIIDNSFFDGLVANYQLYIAKLNQLITNQTKILSRIGIEPDKALNEKNDKLDKEYDSIISKNKKSLNETLKTIEKEYKDSLSKIENNKNKMISRL